MTTSMKDTTLESLTDVASVTADIINKRIRNLHKKQKRIAQIDESVAQGKAINKEQEEALESKKAVCLMIQELEKLRDPLVAAVSDAVKLVLQRCKHKNKSHEKSLSVPTGSSLPEDLLIDILALLPVKSLLRFKCVCKSWFTLFETPSFISQQLATSDHRGILAVQVVRVSTDAETLAAESEEQRWMRMDLCYSGTPTRAYKILNHDTLEVIPPELFRGHWLRGCFKQCCQLLGIHNGVACFRDGQNDNIFIMNLATRTRNDLVEGSKPLCSFREYIFVFGYDFKTGAFKVMRMTSPTKGAACVYDVSTDSWSKSSNALLPCGFFFEFDYYGGVDKCPISVCVNGVTSMLVYRIHKEARVYSLLTFDMSNQVLIITPILGWPDLTYQLTSFLMALDNSVALIINQKQPGSQLSYGFEIFTLNEYGPNGAWIKMYTIGPFCERTLSLEFWKGDSLLVSVNKEELLVWDLIANQSKRTIKRRQKGGHSNWDGGSTLESLTDVASVTADIINKRIRNLLKKQKRIALIDETVAQGKAINKEQEETLESKKAVCLMIQELEKLRDPLVAAVFDAIKLVLQRCKHKNKSHEKSLSVPTGSSLPEDLLIAILALLPVKSLLRFKCVCKSWFTLFETPSFISQQLATSDHRGILAVQVVRVSTDAETLAAESEEQRWMRMDLCYSGTPTRAYKILNHDTLEVIPPELFRGHWLRGSFKQCCQLLGIHNGVACFRDGQNDNIFIMNLATRTRYNLVEGSKPLCSFREYIFVFGYDFKTGAFKVMRMTSPTKGAACVYDVSTDSWSKSSNALLPCGFFFEFDYDEVDERPISVCVNGVTSMLVYRIHGKARREYSLLTFDMSNQLSIITPILGWPDFTYHCTSFLMALENSVALINKQKQPGSQLAYTFEIFALNEYGPNGAWIKMYTIGPFPEITSPLLFWKGDSLLLSINEDELVFWDLIANESKRTMKHRQNYQFIQYKESLVSPKTRAAL